VTAFVVANATVENTGTASITIPIPAGTQAGDLVIFSYIAAVTTGSITDFAAKGWWDLGGAAVNSRSWGAFARVYDPATPASDYTLTIAVATAAKALVRTVRGHGVAASADIQRGTRWRRQDNGGAQGLIVSPTLTTVEDDMLILAFTGEATTTAGGYSVTDAAGFTFGAEVTESAAGIEWLTAWQKEQSLIGATGDLRLTYVPTSANGVGIQYGIPSADIPLGLGFRLSTSLSSTSVTAGVKLNEGTAVEAVLMDGATEVGRQAVTLDAGSGWGTVTIAAPTPDHTYEMVFEIDGVPQSDTLAVRTLPTPGTPKSFVAVAGSCQFTASDHPVFDRIREEQPVFLGHMGDLHYLNPTDLATWRTGFQSSVQTARMQALLDAVPMTWTWDNHDRIIVDDGGAGTPLNLGRTDPATNTEWRKLAGPAGWASADTAGRTWVVGRVRFIQTDQWTMKDDPDAGVATPPLTFLGAAQKQWFKDTLDATTEEVIVWLCQWTGQNHANGRWGSFPDETAELEAFIDARPEVKNRMVLIGGDSHSLQVTDGTRTLADGQRFAGIPNYNISGFNRTSDGPQGGPGWLDDRALRAVGESESIWGSYSRITVTDDGTILTLKWEGVRVNDVGATDIMNTQTLVFGEVVAGYRFIEWDGTAETELTAIEWDGTTEIPLTAEESV